MDLNKAIKNWLMECPFIKGDKMFFNFLSAEDTNQAFLIDTNQDSRLDVLGNEIGTYRFTIVDFRVMGAMPLALNDEDISDFADVSKIIDWIREQIRDRHFPSVDEKFVVDDMSCPSVPILAGIQHSQNMALAKYTIQVALDFIKFN